MAWHGWITKFYIQVTTLSLCLLIATCLQSIASKKRLRYTPDWPSIDSRPLPQWYDEAKFGIFIHWGVFSVPSFGSEWFWWNWKGIKEPSTVNFMKDNFRPGFTYADFALQFQAEFYDADEWADILGSSGAKYVVFVSKHHEGFTNWPSNYSFNWNAKDVGPGRDLVGELATSIRQKTSMKFGIYHSLFEWFNPLFLNDKLNVYQTQDFVKNKCMPELYELVNMYKPEVVWSDGDWDALPEYWNSTEFLAWLYNESPVKDTVVTNDRWGMGTMCRHGGYYTCNDRYDPGVLQPHKWENCMTIDKGSWGYRRNAKLSDYLDMDALTQTLAETVSCGGNLLMNVGPTHDGRILPIFEERLRQMGDWLKVNGEAIYASKPWTHQNDTLTKDVWYTSKKDGVYAIMLEWPANNYVKLGAPVTSKYTKVELLGFGPLPWNVLLPNAEGIIVDLSRLTVNDVPCRYAWVLKLSGLKKRRQKF